MIGVKWFKKKLHPFLFLHSLLLGMPNTLACMDFSFISLGSFIRNFLPLEIKQNVFHNLNVSIVEPLSANSLHTMSPLLQFILIL